MGENGPIGDSNQAEKLITLERHQAADNFKIDLILRRCERKNLQPRQFMLESIKESKLMKMISQEQTDKIEKEMSQLPDIDLSVKEEREDIQRRIFDIMQPVILATYENNEIKQRETEDRAKWENAGLFSYELVDEGERLILHVPDTDSGPGRAEIIQSLETIADIIRQDEKGKIKEVRASSLLLEHPLAKRLGFHINEESDEGFAPNCSFKVEEFLELVKKLSAPVDKKTKTW
jgi:hypothetical protein